MQVVSVMIKQQRRLEVTLRLDDCVTNLLFAASRKGQPKRCAVRSPMGIVHARSVHRLHIGGGDDVRQQ
jgi:hypothetical protein